MTLTAASSASVRAVVLGGSLALVACTSTSNQAPDAGNLRTVQPRPGVDAAVTDARKPGSDAAVREHDGSVRDALARNDSKLDRSDAGKLGVTIMPPYGFDAGSIDVLGDPDCSGLPVGSFAPGQVSCFTVQLTVDAGDGYVCFDSVLPSSSILVECEQQPPGGCSVFFDRAVDGYCCVNLSQLAPRAVPWVGPVSNCLPAGLLGYFGYGEFSDRDGDGVVDIFDKCPRVSDPLQVDLDDDGVGDACDNCVFVSNPDQRDSNGNGIGDACEGQSASPDAGTRSDAGIPERITVANGLLVPDPTCAEFPPGTFTPGNLECFTIAPGTSVTPETPVCGAQFGDAGASPGGVSSEFLGLGCAQAPAPFCGLPSVSRSGSFCCGGYGLPSPPDQPSLDCLAAAGIDHFGFGTFLDRDDDFVLDIVDNCPTVPNSGQADADHDGVGDSCDNCPTVSNPDQKDSIGNGIGDACRGDAGGTDRG